MFDWLFLFMTRMDHYFWSYFAFSIILILGVFLSLKSRGMQIRALPGSVHTFISFLKTPQKGERGVHPLKVFFASVGGMIGIGNIVGIVTAIQIGGPGALFWVWMAALVGSIIKYAEINLGLKHRVRNDRGGYDGGPLYFLKAAFKARWVPMLVAVLLCIYGVEIYQFTVVTDAVASNWPVNRFVVMALLLGMILYAGHGGIRRVGKMCSLLVPIFLVIYLTMSVWIIAHNASALPDVMKSVFLAAFKGHAPLGGFIGSSVLLTIQQGVSRAAYSSDLGIGYDSIIQSESSTVYPRKQASLAVLGVFIDNFICTLTILIVLLTGVWSTATSIEATEIVQSAFGKYFPAMHLFMPLFIFLVGYSTLISYFTVGAKCARFVSKRFGEVGYKLYGIGAFIFFSFFDQTTALLVMSLSGAMLVSINLLGIFRLRHEVDLTPETKDGILPVWKN